MLYPPSSPAKAYRRFIALSHQLKRLLDSGAYYLLPPEKRAWLLDNLRTLYRQLASVMSPQRLRRILASGAAVLALGLPAAEAQLFVGPQRNPFGIDFEEYFPLPQFVDIDGDGDLDILARSYGYYGEGFVLVFLENIGTPIAPAFAPPQVNNFLPSGLAGSATTVAFADIDGDGDYDMFVGTYANYYGAAPILFYENIGTPASPLFAAPQESAFGLQPGVGFSAPVFVDIDGDGDLDFFTAVSLPGLDETHLVYQENIGTANAPAFGAVQNNPFGLPPSLSNYISLVTFGDVDGDGDYDIIAGGEDYLYVGYEYRTYVQYLENVGTPTAPVFAQPIIEPLGIEFPPNSYFSIPVLADIDGDGDVDLFAFGYLYDPINQEDVSVTWYFKNTLTNTSSRETAPVPNYLDIFPTATDGLVNWRLDASVPLDRALHLEAYTPGGQRLERRLLFGAQGSFDISSWPAGHYLFRLSEPDGQPLGSQIIIKR